MNTTDRVERERRAHTDDDVLAKSHSVKGLFRHCSTSPTMNRFERDWARALESVDGKTVLDYGCGRGESSIDLLRRGAFVKGIDISENYIQDARAACHTAGFESSRYEFRVMDAHMLDFPSESFDVVVGRGVLHHLDLRQSLSEIRRVLRPQGIALFHEPLAGNPLLALFRFLTPSARTADEQPLSSASLVEIDRAWTVRSQYYGLVSAPVAVLTSILLRPYDDNFLLRGADWLERKINVIGSLRSLNQYVFLRLIKTE